MKRIWISIGLGFLTPFIGILGAEPFEVPGKNPPMERVGAGFAVVIFCAVCQYLLARQNRSAAKSNLPPVVAMVLTIAVFCVFLIVTEGVQSLPYFAAPVFVAGFIGSVTGMILGRSKGGVTD